MKTLLALCVTTGLLLSASSTASASDLSPEEIAARCVDAIHDVVDRCANASAEETRRCVRKIHRLLADGQKEEAHRVARECIESATKRARNCGERIERICDRCIHILLEMDEPALARRVYNACEDAIEWLLSILKREKNAIRTALGGE